MVSPLTFAHDEPNIRDYIKQIIKAKDTYSYSGFFIYERPDYKSEVYVHQQSNDDSEVHHWVREEGSGEGFLKINGKVSCVTKAYNNRFRANTILQSVDESKLENILHYYNVTLSVDSPQVAGLATNELIFSPKEREGYIYKLVFDKKTFVPLKFIFLNQNQTVLEQGSFSQLTYLANKEDVKPLSNCLRVAKKQPDAAKIDWTVRWIPKGFTFIYSVYDKQGYGHLVYGDGVVSFSVFIEPLTNRGLVNIEKYSGATTLVSQRFIGVDKHPYIAIVVGEIPSSTALRVASSVQFK